MRDRTKRIEVIWGLGTPVVQVAAQNGQDDALVALNVLLLYPGTTIEQLIF